MVLAMLNVKTDILMMRNNQCPAMIQDVWGSIRSRPAQMILSFTTITIGICSLTILVALLCGLQEKSRRMIDDLGANVIGIICSSDQESARKTILKEKHLSYLRINFPDCLITGIRRYYVPLHGSDQDLTVLATDHCFQAVRRWPLSSGRFFDENDIQKKNRHAIVSLSLSNKSGWNVGDVILLKETAFNIVGVIKTSGLAQSETSNLVTAEDIVLIPRTVRPDWIADMYEPESILDAVFVYAPSSDKFSAIETRARFLMSQPDYNVKNITWVTPESLIQGVKKMQKTIKLTVGSIAVLCLFLGGATLMSLMVAEIRHRIEEIGLRRALGASRMDIELMFMIESIVVTLFAGVAGIIAAYILLTFASGTISLPVCLNYISIIVPLIIAIFVGAVFSFWPAHAAAMIAPSEALRNE